MSHPAPLPGHEVIRAVRDETDTVLLSFSCGKDSLALWLTVRERFPHIVPFYLTLVPGLEFVEESLDYYERFFGTHIIRLPHPSFYRWLAHTVFQPPERVRLIEAASIQKFDYDDLSRLIIDEYGLPPKTFTLTGVRAADSPNRLAAIRQYGPINWRRRTAWPIWDMRKQDLVRLFRRSGVRLPIDYAWFGRSFDGIDYRFLSVLREKAPRDYGRILEWFPLAELEVFRYEAIAG